MVFGATRRRRALPVPGRMTGAATESSVVPRKGFSIGGMVSSAREHCGLPRRAADVASIVASYSRKPASTRSASASISVFLAARFLWTQSAASSADWRFATSASNCSRSAADGSGGQNNPDRLGDLLPSTGSDPGHRFLYRRPRSQSRGYTIFVSGAGHVGGAALVSGIRLRAFAKIRRVEVVFACDATRVKRA